MSASKRYQRRKRNELRKIVSEIKAEKGCRDCDESDPVVLQFHHRKREGKVEAISNMISQRRPLERILKEIEKCDILCANCHLKHHHENR